MAKKPTKPAAKKAPAKKAPAAKATAKNPVDKSRAAAEALKKKTAAQSKTTDKVQSGKS